MTLDAVKTVPARRRPSVEKQAVIDAAIKCFKQYGPQRTSMADIADKAGVSRKTLYRMFEDRPSLVEDVLLKLAAHMADKMAKRLGPIKDAKSAIIEGMMISVEVTLEDKLFNEIIQKEVDYNAEQLLVHGNDAILEYMAERWGPIIDQGREEKVIRPSLSDARIFELIMSILSILIMRSDSDEEIRREFLLDLLGAILTD